MEFILKILFTPIVLLKVAKLMLKGYIKNEKAAIITSLLILVIGFLVG